jgi:hypothetical protein
MKTPETDEIENSLQIFLQNFDEKPEEVDVLLEELFKLILRK